MQGKKYKNNISDRVKLVRKELGLTQGEFAELLCIGYQGDVSRIEKGEKPLSNTALVRLSEKYKININWLLTGIGPKYTSDMVKNPPLDPDSKIAELLKNAKNVLTCGNPVAQGAFERNIRYFSQAVDAEKRLASTEGKLSDLEKRLAELEGIKKGDNRGKSPNKKAM